MHIPHLTLQITARQFNHTHISKTFSKTSRDLVTKETQHMIACNPVTITLQ